MLTCMAASHNKHVHFWACSSVGGCKVPSAGSLGQDATQAASQNVMAGVLADHLVLSCNVHALSLCCILPLPLPSLLAMQNRRQLTEITNARTVCTGRLTEDSNPPVYQCICSSSEQSPCCPVLVYVSRLSCEDVRAHQPSAAGSHSSLFALIVSKGLERSA